MNGEKTAIQAPSPRQNRKAPAKEEKDTVAKEDKANAPKEDKAIDSKGEKATVSKEDKAIDSKGEKATTAQKSEPSSADKTQARETRIKGKEKKTKAKQSPTKAQPARAKAMMGSKKGGGGKSMGGGGGGGGANAIDIPNFGGDGGPTLEPKPEGAGNTAIERYTNSGLSMQIQKQAGLGAEAQVDLKKAYTDIESQLPKDVAEKGHEKQATDTALEKGEESKTGNLEIAQSEYKVDAKIDEGQGQSAINQAARNSVDNASEDDIPQKPSVDIDKSTIESGTVEEAIKYSAAMSEGKQKEATLKKDLPERGFDDIKAQEVKVELDDLAMDSGQSQALADVATLSDEAKGILDASEIAESIDSQMQGVQAQVVEAEDKSKTETEQALQKHEQDVESEREKATQEEKATIEQQKAELEGLVQAESAQFDTETQAYDAEQLSLIDAANAELEAEHKSTQTEIDKEHNDALKEKSDKEKEAKDKEKDERSLWEKTKDGLKKGLSVIADWLKKAISAIVTAVKKVICTLLDNFVKVVSLINKDLANKLQAGFDKFKELLDKFAEKLIEIVDRIIDAVVEMLCDLVDRVIDAIENFVNLLKDALNAIVDALKAAYNAAMDKIQSILAGLGEIIKVIFLQACKLAGVDVSIFAKAMSVWDKIIENPRQFATTLGAGLKEGFGNFVANFKEHLKPITYNLMNLWLGAAKISLPNGFNLPSIIRFGLEIIGFDGEISKFLTASFKAVEKKHTTAAWEKDKEKKGKEKEPKFATLSGLVAELKAGNIEAIIPYIKENLGDLLEEIKKSAIKDIALAAGKAAMVKLASFATPASGIVSVLNAVWDMISFVRGNMEGLSALGNALIESMADAALGNTGLVADGVVAVLCQAVPLALDFLLRLAGIDVGAKMKKIIDKIRKPIQAALDKFFAMLTRDKRTPEQRAEDKAKKKEERENITDNQGNPGQYAKKLEARNKVKKDRRDNKVINAKDTGKGLAKAIEGEKYGELGINLDGAAMLWEGKAFGKNVGKGVKNQEQKKIDKKETELEGLQEKQSKVSKEYAEMEKAFNEKYDQSTGEVDPERAKEEKALRETRGEKDKLEKQVDKLSQDLKVDKEHVEKREKDFDTKRRVGQLTKDRRNQSRADRINNYLREDDIVAQLELEKQHPEAREEARKKEEDRKKNIFQGAVAWLPGKNPADIQKAQKDTKEKDGEAAEKQEENKTQGNAKYTVVDK